MTDTPIRCASCGEDIRESGSRDYAGNPWWVHVRSGDHQCAPRVATPRRVRNRPITVTVQPSRPSNDDGFAAGFCHGYEDGRRSR